MNDVIEYHKHSPMSNFVLTLKSHNWMIYNKILFRFKRNTIYIIQSFILVLYTYVNNFIYFEFLIYSKKKKIALYKRKKNRGYMWTFCEKPYVFFFGAFVGVHCQNNECSLGQTGWGIRNPLRSCKNISSRVVFAQRGDKCVFFSSPSEVK